MPKTPKEGCVHREISGDMVKPYDSPVPYAGSLAKIICNLWKGNCPYLDLNEDNCQLAEADKQGRKEDQK